MRKLARTSLLLAALLGCVSIAHGQISVGIRIGPPPAPRVVRVRPASPGPGFMWIDGYWYPVNDHYVWHAGYWSRPPYPGAHWVGPHHDGRQFFAGYWDGPHGRVDHDHRWDRDRDFHDHDRYH